MKRLYVLLAFLLSLGLTQAQTTGSFQIDVDFNESDYDYTRTLYFHVPDDYDESNRYPLVVGFRGGPHSNAGQFRDQLRFLSDSIGAIIICPENIAHFNVNEGEVKQLFNYTVDTVMSMYNIDKEMIYLTGLSFGGRHAVIVSMDEDAGDIPELRGVIPFAAGRNSQLHPDYNRIDDFAPACMCIGLSDAQVFIDVSNDIHNGIISNDGNSLLNEIPGVGHTVAFSGFPNEMMECLNYIESSYPTNTGEVDFIKNEIKIYPNPSRSYFEYSIAEDQVPETVQLIDSSGRIVLHLDPSNRKVNTSSLENGMYALVIRTNDVKYSSNVRIE